MSIFLWVLQALVALVTINGAVWRFMNPAQVVKIASLKALPPAVVNASGVFEIICSLGLIVPPLLHKGALTPIAAAALAVELLLLTAWNVHYFGFQFQATNPAAWSFTLGVLAAFVAYGRFVLRPF